MASDGFHLLSPSPDGAVGVAVVTDAPGLLDEWLGQGSGAALHPVPPDATTRAALAPHPALLFRTIDEHAVDLVRGLDWVAVEVGRLVLLRGLARRPRTEELLEALAATGLEPTMVSRRYLASFDGVELELAPPTGRGVTILAAAHRLATVGRGLCTATAQTPRVAVHGVDTAWVEDLDCAYAIAPEWAYDLALLREASPTVALIAHTQLEGPLTGALESVRGFGGAVVSDQPPPVDGSGVAATLVGLPTPVPKRSFAAHQLYASRHGTAARSPSPAQLAAPERLLPLAAAGVPLAGAPELAATSGQHAETLGPVLSGLLARPLEELAAPILRDLHQIRVRRAAFDLAGTASVWSRIGERLGRSLVRDPHVLVVAISSTPEVAERQIADHRAQRHRDRSLVLVGPGADALSALPTTQEQVRSLPDATLSDLLACARRVGADLVTLFEAGHRYGPEHVGDLVRAMRLSDADLLLRPTEFVVDPVGGTVERVELAAVEGPTRDPEVAAVAVRTEDLAVLDQRAVGASISTPRLAAALLDLGACAYLTHGFGLLRVGPASGVTTPVAADLLPELELSELLG